MATHNKWSTSTETRSDARTETRVTSTVSSSRGTRDSSAQYNADFPHEEDLDLMPAVVMDFSEEFLFSDIVLEVEDRPLHTHRAILSMWSPVFKAMFTKGGFQESASNKVVLSEDKYDEIKELLLHLYTPGGRDMDSEMARRLLPVVHRYQVDILLETVERRLISSVNDSSVVELLHLSEIFSLTSLQKSCMDRCSRLELPKLDRQVEEIGLAPEIHLNIYRQRVMFLEQSINDIQRSFVQSCVKMESKLERVPANHCKEHARPLSQSDEGVQCAACVENLRAHIAELCKRALHKTTIVVVKD